MNTPNGWYIITDGKRESLAYSCTRCGCGAIIGKDCPPRVYCCHRFIEYTPEKYTGLRAFFSDGPALPRVRYKEVPVRPLERESVIED